MIMEIIIMDGRTWMALIFPSSKKYHSAILVSARHSCKGKEKRNPHSTFRL
jgi:3-deoxy-D-manno-octulosonic-acid transferase